MTVIVENPVAMSEVTVKILEEAFAKDCSVSEACLLANISRQSYYNWIKSFPDMAERFDNLRQTAILKARETIINNLGDVSTAQWYLERKLKDEFSTKQIVDNTHIIEINDQIERNRKVLDNLRAVAIQGAEQSNTVELGPVADIQSNHIQAEPS